VHNFLFSTYFLFIFGLVLVAVYANTIFLSHVLRRTSVFCFEVAGFRETAFKKGISYQGGIRVKIVGSSDHPGQKCHLGGEKQAISLRNSHSAGEMVVQPVEKSSSRRNSCPADGIVIQPAK